ncbi:hypothetical protein BAMA_00095 [Bacillus manliponensis]|uniref:DUF3169 domain-containing protein n=1 Tax=Bacillus manliponensis TaxID=574376 RepID=A0A073K3X8_9BACI|nr:DUF3169 family protein [Bacillus manliponensis]KEK21210.1 hypothetical protein BAMA_00095 [Bacillus manliponensis]
MENKVQSRWNGLVILAISAIVGAIGGYGFAAGYKKSPLLTVLIASGAFAIFFLYRFWKVTSKLKNVRDEEESIQGRKLGGFLIYLRASEIIISTWFAYTIIATWRMYTNGGDITFELIHMGLSFTCLLIVIWFGFYAKKQYNTLYPDQRVTYSQSLEMWAHNADEGQKHLVHEAGYKAYQFTNITFAFAWFAAIIYTFLTEINFILLGSISLMYILHIGKYMYELHKRMIY